MSPSFTMIMLFIFLFSLHQVQSIEQYGPPPYPYPAALLTIKETISLVITRNKETPFLYLSLRASCAPEMKGVKTHFWKYHPEMNGNTVEKLSLQDEDTAVLRIDKTNEMIPGSYMFVLYRCDFINIVKTTFNVTITAEEGEEKTIKRGQIGELNRSFLRALKFASELCHGLMVYFHALNDYIVNEEEFLSSGYAQQWKEFGLNVTHYETIKTPADIRAFKEGLGVYPVIAYPRPERDTMDGFRYKYLFVNHYFKMNNNSHGPLIHTMIVGFVVSVCTIITSITAFFSNWL